MRNFILYYQDGHVEEAQALTLEEAIKGKEKLSYYEEPKLEAQVKDKLSKLPDEEVKIAIVPRCIKVPSAHEPGKTYDVIIQPNGNLYCPCIGFANRHYCWHSNYVHELLEEEKRNAKA